MALLPFSFKYKGINQHFAKAEVRRNKSVYNRQGSHFSLRTDQAFVYASNYTPVLQCTSPVIHANHRQQLRQKKVFPVECRHT